QEVAVQPDWHLWLEQLTAQNRVLRLTAPSQLWIAAERLPDFQALWPELKTREDIVLTRPAEPHPRDNALIEIIRGRLEGLGPVTASALARPLGAEVNTIATALA